MNTAAKYECQIPKVISSEFGCVHSCAAVLPPLGCLIAVFYQITGEHSLSAIRI